MFSNIILLYDV